ncbi:MAG: baseplate J/gp47 family protein [Lachnospiraceae bacterium]|nr:baseplate J/gp47 family protein [Lachnospiraceae bacterium]
MFEDVTYEVILQRMLDRIPDSMDKREGSVIYDALAPAAVELQNMYIELEYIMNESFADTASLPNLIRKVSERGLAQKQATHAVLKVVSTPVNVDIPIGSRFSIGSMNYKIIEKITGGEYKAECESVGSAGNSYLGNLIPIDYVEGLESIQTTEVLIPGEDEEDAESLRKRYFESFDSQAYGGNIADYRQKTKGIPGVGGVKVTPTWNGGGTVKLTIIDSIFGVPSSELVGTVQEVIDPVNYSGEGSGVAPIGHVVTVEAAEGVAINITANITYADKWSWEASATSIRKAVNDYFTELSSTWDDKNDTELIVRISQLESRLLQCDGVIDVSETKLNGSAANLYLTKHQIPVGGLINGN